MGDACARPREVIGLITDYLVVNPRRNRYEHGSEGNGDAAGNDSTRVSS